jgi:hypothetical protein
MRVCILNSTTKIVENIIELDTLDATKFVPYKQNIELSTRHDGQIGWKLENNEWITNEIQFSYEEKCRKIRNARNAVLFKSDKYLVSDYPISEQQRNFWIAYRQSLRDITSQEGFPDNVIWPQAPNN